MSLPKEKSSAPTNPPLSVSAYLPASLLMMAAGFGGLIFLVAGLPPTVGARWLFFFLGVVGVSGAALLAAAYLNRRFPSLPPPTHGVILRQALWVGIYVPTLAWLQVGRVLSVALALLLLLGFVIIELLLRLRERSQWKP